MKITPASTLKRKTFLLLLLTFLTWLHFSFFVVLIYLMSSKKCFNNKSEDPMLVCVSFTISGQKVWTLPSKQDACKLSLAGQTVTVLIQENQLKEKNEKQKCEILRHTNTTGQNMSIHNNTGLS